MSVETLINRSNKSKNIIKTKLLKNINNEENNLDFNEQLLDNKITNNSEVNYFNLPNWPKRSPFEYYNKNIIIPDNYKISTIDNNNSEKYEKLNPINDNLNPLIPKSNNNSDNITVSIINPNKENISIHDISNNGNNINNNNFIGKDFDKHNINNSIKNIIDKPNNDILNENDNNENYNAENESVDEQDIIYNNGYNKDEKVEPIQLLLIKDSIGEDEKSIALFHNKIQKEKYEQKLKEENAKMKNKKTKIHNHINKSSSNSNNHINRNKTELNNAKIKQISKSEKDIKYFQEKDLFDEKINNQILNITQKQMDILDEETNRFYNYFKEISKRKKFEIMHPYLEYEKFKLREKISQHSMDNHLTLLEKNEIKQKRLKPIIDKQKSIIKDIINNKKNNFNIHNHVSMSDINSNYKITNNNISSNSSIFINNSIDYNKKNKKNSIRKNFLNLRSYSKNDYRKKYENQKINSLGGLGANIGGEEWQKRQKLLEKKKQYSDFILFNKNRNLEMPQKYKLIKKIKINDNNDSNNNINEKDKYLNDFKFPLIKHKLMKKDNNIINNKKENKVYISSFCPTKKYKIKKETNEEKFNKILSKNQQLEILFHNHNKFNKKFENIKSHMK